MEQQIRFIPFMILWLAGDLAFFVIALLVLRFAAKLKWLTAICLSVFATTIISILGVRFIPGPGPHVKGSVSLLPAAVCAVIMIIQFFRWMISSDNASVNSAERDRILKMVEEGKINTEEGTELLDSMGRSSALRGEEKFSKVDMIMLMGAALVVLGFFLPWAYIRWGVYQSGYDVKAIGWAVLIIGIATVIPIFVTPKNFLYKISMLQIFLNLIGIALVVSLLVQVGENLGIGLIFCLAGFLVETVAAVTKFKKLAA
ncbi:MAG: SHOCT-like domain-containing protein [Planctomycetota bacterium]|jgi:hypothetical protein